MANTNPVVVAPADKTIPIRTPFTLTGSGTDDDSDPLVYLWEQTDTGSGAGTGLVDNNKLDGPLFRMFGTRADVSLEESLQSPSPDINLATSDPSRTFPDLAQVVADNTNAETGTCPARARRRPPWCRCPRSTATRSSSRPRSTPTTSSRPASSTSG